MEQQCTLRRPLPFLIIGLCFASLYLPSVSSQTGTDSCSNSLSLGSLVPFNTTGLTCFQAWTSQDFILRFGKASSGSNVWNFLLSAPDNGGYISIGFSPTAGRMVGSSAVAGWVSSAGGAGSAKQYYLGGKSSSSCPPDQGKLTLARGAAAPSIVSKGSRLYLAFQLSGQPLTDVVYAVGSLPGSNNLLPQHQDAAAGTISLSGGSTGGGSPATGGGGDDDDDGDGEGKKGKGKHSGEGSDDGGDDEGKGERRTSPSSASSSGASGGAFLTSKRRHGVLAVVSWGVLIPAGVALARFFKRFDPFWFYAHVVAQGLGFVVGVLAIVAGFKLDDDEGPVGIHKAIGVVVLVGACLQVLALLARPAKETKARRYWNWYHHNVGRVAIVLGVANIFYGLSLAKERQEWSYVYGIFIGVFAIVYLVLEEWRSRH